MAEVLYLSIIKDIKAKIQAGEYAPGDMLPSEIAMTKTYGASRMTIRKSLSMLSNEGYIYSVPGKGSFVSAPETDVYQLTFKKYEFFTEEIDEVKLLSVDVVDGEPHVRKKLEAKSSDYLLKVVRLICADNHPIAVEYTHFVYAPQMPIVEERLKFANHLDGIERLAGFSLEKALKISALQANEKTAKHLGCSVGDTLIYLEEEAMSSQKKQAYYYIETFTLPAHISISAATSREEDGS